jgi:glutamate--cysteine ligase
VTLDRNAGGELERPIGSLDDLVAYFRGGEKPAERWRVGLEHEKLGLQLADLRPVPYEGERGIGELLERIARSDGWQRVYEGSTLVALDREVGSVTLEPGGQFEFSGRPAPTVHELRRDLEAHLALVKRESEPLGLVWLALGNQPFHDVADVPRMPKERYRIMREYLPRRGALALDMMHVTASVQASFDFADEADMTQKLRLALGLAPVTSALFANSSLAAGKPSGFVSRRVHIWRNTDPDRCGLLPFVFEPGFGYRRYAEWALDVPMFFIVREGRYLPMHGKSFRRFWADGHAGHVATLADFERHLTTLFPEARLKRLIEVRSADAVALPLALAVPALWKGLLYHAGAREAALELARVWDTEEREGALEAVARAGLAARVGRRAVLDLAREMVAIAARGLQALGQRDAEGRDESALLEPLQAVLERGTSPGQVVLERWEGEWRRDPRRLIEATRY